MIKYFITRTDDEKKMARTGWAKQHWIGSAVNEETSKSIQYDVFGGGNAKMCAIEAFFCYLRDAVDFLSVNDVDDVRTEFGYESFKEAERVYNGLEEAYKKMMDFFDDDEEKMVDWFNQLNEEWG